MLSQVDNDKNMGQEKEQTNVKQSGKGYNNEKKKPYAT